MIFSKIQKFFRRNLKFYENTKHFFTDIVIFPNSLSYAPEEVGWLYRHALRLIIIHNCDFRQTFSEKLLKYIAIFIFEDIIFSKVCFYICIIEEPN
jgi:hypothetical protein